MQTRVAVMAVIVEDDAAAEKLNAVLHHYGEHIIGRMGIPYRARGINIILTPGNFRAGLTTVK